MARVLILNAGSSSLKASVIEVGRREALARTTVGWGADATRAADRRQAVTDALDRLTASAGGELDAVGHRVVHGGLRFREPTLVDDTVLHELDALDELAPLHNPVAVETIRAARDVLPELPHGAAFDTTFHSSLEPAAYVYPLPWRWHTEWGVRRFGFHGLSVEWSVRRAGELLRRDPTELGLIVAHLGSGCSISAVQRGRSVSTSMGWTPLEGTMMGTRGGSFDPGVVVRLLTQKRLSLSEMSDALEHGSGLLGVSGVSGDMREVQAAARDGNERASLAIAMFCRRAAGYIAGGATSLSRLDALVFTGGIGENSADVRRQIVGRLGVLGVAPLSDKPVEADAVLSDEGAQVPVLRVEAREDLVIAEHVAALVSER